MYKAIEIARWFIAWANASDDDDYDLSNMKLQKLLYFAQAHVLGRTGSPLYGDEIQAWSHGPVVPPVYRAYKDRGSAPIDPGVTEDFNWDSIDEDTTQLLIETWDMFGGYSAAKLRDISHTPGGPWSEHWVHDRTHVVIPLDGLHAAIR